MSQSISLIVCLVPYFFTLMGGNSFLVPRVKLKPCFLLLYAYMSLVDIKSDGNGSQIALDKTKIGLF